MADLKLSGILSFDRIQVSCNISGHEPSSVFLRKFQFSDYKLERFQEFHACESTKISVHLINSIGHVSAKNKMLMLSLNGLS